MSGTYDRLLDGSPSVVLYVDFKTSERGRQVVDYSVILAVEEDGRMQTVRLYDGAHGKNEMHRYTRDGGKQAGAVFDRGTLGEGMRIAIGEIEHAFKEMIDGWRGA
jgi:hypothetical protein